MLRGLAPPFLTCSPSCSGRAISSSTQLQHSGCHIAQAGGRRFRCSSVWGSAVLQSRRPHIPLTHSSRLLPVRLRPCARADQTDSDPPKPAARFSRKDVQRIETQGPRLTDLVRTEVVELADDETPAEVAHFVPGNVLGNVGYEPEPRWSSLSQMPYMEFYKGLRERNWTHPAYNPNAPPWRISFFEDSGRFLRPAFDGFRALVTKEDGSQVWVNMPAAGADAFLRDYTAGGGGGGIYRYKRVPSTPLPSTYGYNQVFEQLFQAFEQQLPKELEEKADRQGWLDPKEIPATACPAERHLQISFNMTPKEYSLRWLWEGLPPILFFIGSVSFLGVCLAIGIFRPRKVMPSDPIQAMEFAQSKGKARREGNTGVTFADVAGMEYIEEELQDIVSFLKAPGQYGKLGTKPPKGVLLEGDPGNGKTLIAKAVAGEAGVPFYQMAGAEFVETIVGVGAARVRDLFKRARVNAPCIIFVDEVDALGTKRAGAGVQANEEREQTLNQLLTEMDGFTPDIGVVFIGATNRADLLDPALLRSGRFDRKVRIQKPDAEARYDILKVHARKKPLEPDVDLRQIAQDLPGLSGAELANVLNEGALEAVRRDADAISATDIYNAVDRILQGVRRPSLPDRLQVKRALAVHEAGRGLVATLLRRRTGFLERIERVSMVPRGQLWTRTVFLRGADEDYTMTTRNRLLERIRVVLAGRAAEDALLPGGATNYSASDLKDAARLASKLVTAYGLSDLGITTFAPPSPPPGFGRKSFEVAIDNIDADLFGNSDQASYFQPSDDTRHKVKMVIHDILIEAYDEDLELLRTHKDALEILVQQLLEKETVTGSELDTIVDTHPPTPPGSGSAPAYETVRA